MTLTEGDPSVVGGYELRSRLGAGGMGVVYLAVSESGREVAVKVLHEQFTQDPEFRARFRREVMAARRVSGARTAPVLDADPDAELPWMATLYIPGVTLARRVRDQGPLRPDGLRRLARGMAQALRDIHRAGVTHRDLKPSNVLLADDGVRVIDFGISRATGTDLLTHTGKIMGTPPFMAPEQFQTPKDVGPPADVFAFGSVLVYAATGRAPFDAGSPHVSAYRVVYEEADLDDVPEALRPVVARCLRKVPRARPSAADLVSLLDERHHGASPGGAADAGGAAPGNAVQVSEASPGPAAGVSEASPGTAASVAGTSPNLAADATKAASGNAVHVAEVSPGPAPHATKAPARTPGVIDPGASRPPRPLAPPRPPAYAPLVPGAPRWTVARPAPLGKRLAARLLDTVAVGAVTAVAAVPLGGEAVDHIDAKIEAARLSGETVTVWLLDGTTAFCLGAVLAVLLVSGALYEALPTARWGQSPGKKLLGLRVEDVEAHTAPGFGAALRRWLVYSVPALLLIGVVGMLWCVFDRPWRRCWHDRAARTVVAH